MKKYLETIKPFFTTSICFIVLLFCVKFFELFTSGSIRMSFVVEMIYGNLIASLFLSFSVFIIFNIISIFSKKSAFYISSILFSLIIISEISLIFYHNSTGLIMGRELIERPLWETVATVKSVLNFWMIAAAILFIIAFVFINVKIANRQKLTANSQNTTKIMLVLTLISLPLLLILKPNQNVNAVNKIWYCFHSCFLDKANIGNIDINLTKIEYDEAKIQEYRNIFPEREVIDNQYPLEVKDNIDNVLGPYFQETKRKPNVVVIIVESLGADLFGINEYGYTFTPFLDSLSKHSLLWTNCLATTPRSFGAVPAITGSVPHGTKGFQFGDIPEHNSLFAVLKDNDYETSAFYAGDFSFDNVYDYLIAQKIDFLAPLNEDQKKKENRHYDYTYWGYQDKVMFDKSMEIIEQRNDRHSYFDLFITISQHDNRLRLNDKKRTDVYYDKAREIIATLPEKEHKGMNEILGHLAATIYGDESIKHFIERYQKYDKNNNTIFVITGDHSLNLNSDNQLDAFHVPLIIWSPLLKEPRRFEAVVSHNDIVPSLNALLRDNFGLKTPYYIHWVGNELDTTSNFHCDLNTCFLRYTRRIFDGVFGNYYYTVENNSKNVYRIKENLELEKVDDKEIIRDVDDKFNSLVYVDNYAYTNNKLTKNPIITHNEFRHIESVVIDSVYCTSNEVKPSERKPDVVKIYSTDIDSKYEEIKIIMTADIKYTGKVWQDQFINLGIDCRYGKKQEINSLDNISKSIVEKNYSPNKWLKLELTKTFYVKDSNNNDFEIYLKPTDKDYHWNPEHSITLKNINITILGN